MYNEINIGFLCTLKKNKKSHLSPANDIMLITDDLYDPYEHQALTCQASKRPEHAKSCQHEKKKLTQAEVILINHNFSHEFKNDVNKCCTVNMNITVEHQDIGNLV